MAKGGRIAGGVLAIIGSALVLVAGLMTVMVTAILFPLLMTAGIGAILWGTLGLVGGILLLTDSTAGGVLALVGGIGDLVGIFVLTMVGFPFGAGFIFVDPFLILVGGIVGLAVGSEL